MIARGAILLGIMAGPISAQGFTPIRVNVGGAAYTDSADKVWAADAGYNTGSASYSSAGIAATSDPALFQTNRWDAAGPPELAYQFAVPNGQYRVRLLFAETWSGAYYVGARRFTVQIEGSPSLQNFDVFAEAGANTALTKTVSVAVTDGALNIEFLHVVENPFVNGIEITDAQVPTAPTGVTTTSHSATQINLAWTASADDVGITAYEVERCQGQSCANFVAIAGPNTTSYRDSGLIAATTYRYRVRAVDGDGNRSEYSAVKTAVTQSGMPMSPVRINVGGGAYTDSIGRSWAADSGGNTGYSAWTSAAISGTTNPQLYQTLVWDSNSAPELEYLVSVPPGQYEVNLHFAESWSGAFYVGARRFAVQLEGATVFANLDVYAEAGANAALVKTASVAVGDNQLSIRFVHIVENPFLNGIEVLPGVPSDGEAPTAPVDLAATPVSVMQLALSWSPSSDNVGVTGYAVERCDGLGCTNFTEVSAPLSNGWTDTGLSSATLYRYRVRARDAAGNYSAYSAILQAMPQQGAGTGSVHFSYDELGRLAHATQADGSTVVYGYDESGNVVSITRLGAP